MRKTAFAGLAVGLSLLLAACAGSQESREELSKLPSFQAGYADGCRSAHTNTGAYSGKVYKNKELFAQDSGYRAGWRDGYAACGGRDQRNSDPFYDRSGSAPLPL